MRSSPIQSEAQRIAGQRTVQLMEAWRRPRRGRYASQLELTIKAAALDVLRELDTPSQLVTLFDLMLGGVAHRQFKMKSARPWVDDLIEYEAQETFLEHAITNAEAADLVMLLRSTITSRTGIMAEIRKLRAPSDEGPTCYETMVADRRLALFDRQD